MGADQENFSRDHMKMRFFFLSLFYSRSFAKFAAKLFLICAYLRLEFFQGLTQILNQIVGMFQADRHAQEIFRAAGVGAFNGRSVLD